MPRPCAHSSRPAISSSLTPLSATALIFTCRPAACAASMPASTLSRSPQRVMARNLSASSVSSETLMRSTPCAFELGGVFLQLRAIGGEREFLERAACEMARQRGHQRHDAAPHQRLAAGQAQLGHALGDEGAAQPVEFLEAEQIGLRQKRHVLRHAIDAAEIAAVGHRDAQIGDGARKRIDQRARAGAGAIEFERGVPLANAIIHPREADFLGSRFRHI